MNSTWQLKYKNPHFVYASSTDTQGSNVSQVEIGESDANAGCNYNYIDVTAALLSATVDCSCLPDDISSKHDDSRVLILVVKLSRESQVLTFELLSMAKNTNDDNLEDISIVYRKDVFWPKYVNEQVVAVGFLRNRSRNSTSDEVISLDLDDAALQDILLLLDFDVKADKSIETRSKAFERLINSEANIQSDSSLRLLLLTERGGLRLYDPFVFFHENKSNSMKGVLENLLFGNETRLSKELISDYGEALFSGDLSIRTINLDAPVEEQFRKIYSIRLKVFPDYCIIYGHGRLLLESGPGKSQLETANRKKKKMRNKGSFVIYLSCIDNEPHEYVANIYRNKFMHNIQPVYFADRHRVLWEKTRNRHLYDTPYHSLRKNKHEGLELHTTQSVQGLHVREELSGECRVVCILPLPASIFHSGSILHKRGDKGDCTSRFRQEFVETHPVILFVSKSMVNYGIFSIRESIESRHILSYLIRQSEYRQILGLIDILWDETMYNLADKSGHLNFGEEKTSEGIESGILSMQSESICKEELVQLYLESYFALIDDIEKDIFERVHFYLSSGHVSCKSLQYILEMISEYYEGGTLTKVTHILNLILFMFSNGDQSFNISVDSFFTLLQEKLSKVLGIDIPASNEEMINFVQSNVKLFIKYNLVSEYVECCWNILHDEIRYKIIFLSDSSHCFYPFLHLVSIHNWLMDQLKWSIEKKETIIQTDVLLELISCIINLKVTTIKQINRNSESLENAMSHYHTCNDRLVRLCESHLREWDYDVLFLALLILSDEELSGGSYGILVRDRDDSKGADILTLDDSGHHSIAELPIDALLHILAQFLTPRDFYTMFNSTSKSEVVRYVDFKGLLQCCHKLQNVYVSGIFVNDFKLTLIGIIQKSGIKWSLEKCWNVLTETDFVGNYLQEFRDIVLPSQVAIKVLSRIHLHALDLLDSHTDIEELRFLLRTIVLLNLHTVLNLEKLDTSVGAPLIRILLFDNDFASTLSQEKFFSFSSVMSLAYKCSGLTKCLPDHVLNEILNSNGQPRLSHIGKA